jgi:hypothetical protein
MNKEEIGAELFTPIDQAWNRLTVAAGSLVMAGAGVAIAAEGKVLTGTVLAAGLGSFSALYGKLGWSELREARSEGTDTSDSN